MKDTIKQYTPSILFCLAFVVLLGIVGQMDYDDAVLQCKHTPTCKL